MKKIVVVLMVAMMAFGFDWSIPQETQTGIRENAKESGAFFMTSVSTLNYQGQKIQNRVQTVSLAKTERQMSAGGTTYVLSGQGGFRIGKEGTGACYEVSPVTVKRDLSTDRLSSDVKGLGPWLGVINGTLQNLFHKKMMAEAWEEPIVLLFPEDAFPGTVQVRFTARPLPSPVSQWLLVTADSGMVSFRALDEKYRDSLIYGQYRSILVYAPESGKFLQAAAAFILYHGEDHFRIEQLHFAADENGKQLYPLLKVDSYLGFKTEAPTITNQGAFPSWCIQAAQVFDVLHLAVMTAAEGATNPVSISTLNEQLLNLIHSDYNFILKTAGKLAAEQLLDDWMKVLNFYNTERDEGTAKALKELFIDLGKDLILEGINVLPFGIGSIYKIMEMYFKVQQASFDQMEYDVNELTRAPFPQKKPEIKMVPEENTSPPVVNEPVRSVPKVPKMIKPGLFAIIAGIVAVGGGLLVASIIKKGMTPGNSANKYDGTYNYSLTNVHGMNPKCYSCVTISGGIIRNSEGSFSGSVSSNGDLSFNGPCPNGNSAKGSYVGHLVQSSPSYKWSGQWTCADGSKGGANSIWTIWR